MFWKKKEEPSSSFQSSNGMSASSSSFNPLDVQSPPAFGDVNSGMAGAGGMNSGAPNPYPSGFDSPSGAGSVPADPFSQSAPTGFGQSPYGSMNSATQMMGQMQNSALPTNPISTLPSRSAPADPNAIHPRDVELILSRLELIRAEIENVNHRLAHLEQNAQMKSTGTGKNKAWY